MSKVPVHFLYGSGSAVLFFQGVGVHGRRWGPNVDARVRTSRATLTTGFLVAASRRAVLVGTRARMRWPCRAAGGGTCTLWASLGGLRALQWR